MRDNIITPNRLKELLNYDNELGVFTWIKPTSNIVKAGQLAGTPHSMGYTTIKLDRYLYLAHRLAWFYVHGSWPNEIDHIAHNKTNNKISNLRDTSHSDNMKNQKIRNTNTSGINGVYWDASRGKWASSIHVKNRNIHLGRFVDIEDAKKARSDADKKYLYHQNHGDK